MEKRTKPNDNHGEDDTPAIYDVEDDFWDYGSAGSALKSLMKRRRKRRNNEEASSGLMKSPTTRGESKQNSKREISSRSEESASSARRNVDSGCRGEGRRISDLDTITRSLEEEEEPVFHDEALLESLRFMTRKTAPPGLFLDGRLVAPTQLRRQPRLDQSPGAIYVDGDGGRRRMHDEELDYSASSTVSEDPATTNDVLVQAQLVRMNTNVLVTATPDPWWRRHQWWLAGATAIVIVLVVVLSTVDLGGSETSELEATTAPTSLSEGIEARTFQQIVSVLPSSTELLKNESTPQYQALQWVVQRQLDSDDSDYTETSVLQLYGLAALFLSTNEGGASWRQTDGWLSSVNSCSWYGVECEEDNVVGLNLKANGLAGTIISDVFLLGQSLRVLDLSNNELSGSLSEEVGMMKLLTQLCLEDNYVSGTFPSSLASMLNLALLDLSSNSLASTIPTELGALKAMKELRLSGNSISGQVPAAFGSLSNLVHLDVSDNDLSFSLPAELGQLRHLKTLKAETNSLLGPLPTEIGLLSSLETLTLSDNFIFNVIPTEIGSLTKLRSLDASHNLFSGSVPLAVASLRQLSTLRLQSNFLHGRIPVGVQDLDKLEVLDLSENYMVAFLPPRVWALPNLRYFNVSLNELSNRNNDVEWGSPSLQVLDMSYNRFGPFGLNSTMGVSTNLTILDISNNYITTPIPTEIGALSQLVSIDLSNNILNGPVPSELWALPKLQSLNLANNPVSGLDVFPGVLALSNLTELRLSDTILSAAFPSQIGMLTSLKSLWLDNARLTGALPTEVGLLTTMEDFKIVNNAVSGSIPSEVGYLSKLQRFEVGSNKLNSTVPTELFSLSQLKVLDVASNLLSGVIPTQISMLSRMELFVLTNNGFSDTIPTEVGLMTALQHLDLTTNSLVGSIPTVVGQLSELISLHLDSNILTGTIPSEIGLARNLNTLVVSNNGDLAGTIPSELGLLRSMDTLDIGGNQLVGSLPSEIRQLSQLVTFRASDNLLSGPLPSLIGEFYKLYTLHLENNPSIRGHLPTGMEMPPNLLDFNISGTAITGSFPDGMCRRLEEFNGYGLGFGDSAGYDSLGYGVDCILVACDCCGCPTPMPSASPSATFPPSNTPSKSDAPSYSLEPSWVPSASLLPSASLAPSSIEGLCSPFSSMASVGSRLAISGEDNQLEVVDLPVAFNWRGEADYTRVTVGTNGMVFLGVDGIDDGCCRAEPITTGERYNSPRIAIAQNDLAPAGSIYTALVENAFIVSWEGVFGYYETPQNALNFQVLLFEDGTVELRWGEGNPIFGQFAAGLEDDPVDLAKPVTGYPFDGAYGSGISRRWPSYQCRVFVASGGGYTEIQQ